MTRTAAATRMPDYDAQLRAFHAAFSPELTRAVAAVPLPPDARVLDVPCGDGFYARRLAARLGPAGRVVAADLSPAYLARARRRLRRDGRVSVERADVYALPFGDGSFDAVWCAQSFISLADPGRALAEMRRVLRPGGVVAVLEDDALHRVVLPWPVGLEAEMQAALREASRAAYGRGDRVCVARRMRPLLLKAGLRPHRRRTFAADRVAPFGRAERRFLELYLNAQRDAVAEFLPAESLARLDAFRTPRTRACFWERDDVELTCLTTLWTATTP